MYYYTWIKHSYLKARDEIRQVGGAGGYIVLEVLLRLCLRAEKDRE